MTKKRSIIFVSDKYKTIFVRVPKTGSTSIVHSIGNIFDKKYNNTLPEECHVLGGLAKHIPASDIAKHMPEIWKNYFTFSFVRNPYYHVISAYYQLKNKESHGYPSLYDSTKMESIESFMPYILEHFPKWIRQDLLLFDSNGNQLVDYIGKKENLQPKWLKQRVPLSNTDNNQSVDYADKYENIQSDYKFVCNKIGIKPKPLARKRTNQTNVDYDRLLTPYLKSMIAYELRDTFEILGYKI